MFNQVLQNMEGQIKSQANTLKSDVESQARDQLLSNIPKSFSSGIKVASLIHSGLNDIMTPEDKFRHALLLLRSNNEFKNKFSKAVNMLIADAVYNVMTNKSLVEKPQCIEENISKIVVNESDVKEFFKNIIILNTPVIETQVKMLYKLKQDNLYNYFYVEEEEPESYPVSSSEKVKTIPEHTVKYDFYDGLLKIFINGENDFSNILKKKLAPIVNKKLIGKELKIYDEPVSFNIFSVSDGVQLAIVEFVKAIICKGKQIFYENPSIAYEQKNKSKVVGGRKTKKRRKRGFLIKGGVIGRKLC